MTGFSGRISIEGDAEGAASVMGDAIKHASVLNAWKQTQGIDNVIRAYDLEHGYYCVVVDLKHMRAIRVVAPPEHSYDEYSFTPVDELVETVGVIDVISGRVGSPTIVKTKVELKDEKGQTIKVNNKAVTVEYDVLASFTPTTKTQSRHSDLLRRRRLAVRENSIFVTLTANPSLADVVWSEHAHVRPTCYSGPMRKAAQLVLGIGNILRPTYEEKWMKEKKKPSLVLADKNIRSAFQLYERTEPSVSVQLAWDYRFAKTHNITFDKKGVPWLVEVSTRGVHAMPLYMDPVSQTESGKQRYLDVSPELTEPLNLFNGIPLGVTMPLKETFTNYKNAGEVVELLSAEKMSEFYSKYAFSSELGWCFDEFGMSAHNTCYSYDTNGIAVGHHFVIYLFLNGETLPKFREKTSRAAALFGNAAYKIKKCRRMSDSEADRLIRLYEEDAEAAVKAFDELKVTPTLTGTVTLIEVDKGQLFHPAKFKGQPQIKFPEPIVGGLVSFDFTPAGGWNSVPEAKRPVTCDGPMFVAFGDEGLDVVRYFYDPRPQGPGYLAYTTREVCQFTGKWETYGKTDPPYMHGNFYSTKIDWREQLHPETEITYSKGRQISTHNYAAAEFFFATCIRVIRNYVFWITNRTERIQNQFVRVSVAIPEGDRCAYYMMKHYGASAVWDSESAGATTIPGPYVHYYQLYQFAWHWFGRCYVPPGQNPQGGLQCVAKKMSEVIQGSCVDVENAQPPDPMVYSVCPSTSGNGISREPITIMASWSPPSIIGSAAWSFTPSPSSYTTWHKSDEAEQGFEIVLMNESGHGEVVTKKQRVTGIDPATGQRVDFYSLNVSDWWFRASPDEDTGACPSLSVTHSCLGFNVMNYMDDLDGNTESIGMPQNMHAGSKTCYTGVIE